MTTLISGAAGALGAVVTELFLEKGSNVHAACYSPDEETRLKRLFLGAALTSCVCNASAADGIAAWFASAPACDAVVHLVGGIQAGKPLSKTDDAMFDSMSNLNARSTFLVLRAAMNALPDGGAIVTVAAKAALRPEPNKSVYAAAKAAVVALTLTAAEEGKPRGIRANCIVPGILRTAANLEWAENGEENLWTPPEDAAATIYALATTPGINGAVVPLYGKLPA